MIEKCNQCPRNCNIDRENSAGYCGEKKLRIARASLHFGEEPILVGKSGSGTIFFSGCSLKCVYCQNYSISQGGIGKEISVRRLAEIYKELEEQGAVNINLVNPTHFAGQIIESLDIYKPGIPVVWNTSGYEKIETLKRIEKYVNIYLSDFKYYDGSVSLKYSRCTDYAAYAVQALEEMKRQKNDTIKNNIMTEGVIVRHLILPCNTDQSIKILNLLKNQFGTDIYLSLMAQYLPCGKAAEYPNINRKITLREYNKVSDYAFSLEFKNLFLQELSSAVKDYIPDFDFTGVW